MRLPAFSDLETGNPTPRKVHLRAWKALGVFCSRTICKPEDNQVISIEVTLPSPAFGCLRLCIGVAGETGHDGEETKGAPRPRERGRAGRHRKGIYDVAHIQKTSALVEVGRENHVIRVGLRLRLLPRSTGPFATTTTTKRKIVRAKSQTSGKSSVRA